MRFNEYAVKKAQQNVRKIVLPEGDERRTMLAAAKLQQEHIVTPVLLGDPDRIRQAGKEAGADLSDIEIIDPRQSEKREEYTEILYELRKAKGGGKGTGFRSDVFRNADGKERRCGRTGLRSGTYDR